MPVRLIIRTMTARRLESYSPLNTDEVVLIIINGESVSAYFENLDSNCGSFNSLQERDVAMFTPHAGLQDSTTPKDAPLRQSIELRALVF